MRTLTKSCELRTDGRAWTDQLTEFVKAERSDRYRARSPCIQGIKAGTADYTENSGLHQEWTLFFNSVKSTDKVYFMG